LRGYHGGIELQPKALRCSFLLSRLNLLNLEAVATAHWLQATVWLSPQGASGIVPGVLEAEDLEWQTVSPT
jgi:hypothetical protein